MAKTYPLKALWPLLPFEVAPAPLQATLDAYGGGLVKYAVSQDGIWLYSLADPLTASESENLTGFHPADLVPKQIDGVEGYFYALLGGAPLLPIPFTANQLVAFNERTAGLIAECIERGIETDAWIADLEKDNPDAAELARGIHGGKWPVDLADIVDTTPEDVAKPRFRLADGIELNASAKGAKSAFDEVQRQQDQMRLLGISPDMLKAFDWHKEMEKLIGNSAGSLANASYMDELKRNQGMLRVMNPSASELAAEALGRQLTSSFDVDTVGSAAKAYLESQSTARVDIEKALGGSMGTVADAMRQHEALGYANTVAEAYRQTQYPQRAELEKIVAMVCSTMASSIGQLDRAGLDAAMGRFQEPTVGEMFALREKELLEKAMAPPEPSERVIEFTPLPFYDHQAAEKRRLDRERQHRLETERLAVLVRLKTEEEYEANKQSTTATSPKIIVDASPSVIEYPPITKGTHRHLLTPVIEAAQQTCADPHDTPAVWSALCVLAEKKYRPLFGISQTGIQWKDGNDEPQELTLKMLRDRLYRQKRPKKLGATVTPKL